MVFLLGKHFPDTQLVTKTLTSLYGISELSSSLRSRAPAAVPYKLLFPANAQAQAQASTSPPAAASKQEHAQRQSASSQAQAKAHAAPLSPQRHSLLGRILARHQIHPTARLNELSDQKMQSLAATLDELNSQNSIENNLRRKIREDIKRLRDMGSYRGRRHAFGLPVRGQKTKGQIMTAKRLNRMERRG